MKLNNLAKLRKLYKLKQSDIAEFLGVHVVTYSNYETGAALMDTNQLCELATLFDTSTDYILGRHRIIRTTTYEKIAGEFVEVDTISDQVKERLKKKGQ